MRTQVKYMPGPQNFQNCRIKNFQQFLSPGSGHYNKENDTLNKQKSSVRLEMPAKLGWNQSPNAAKTSV